MAFDRIQADSGEKKSGRPGAVGTISDRQLTVGLWFIRYRARLLLALIAVLLITGLATVGYSLFEFGRYLIFGIEQDRRVYFDLTSTASMTSSQTNAGSNIHYSETRVIPIDNERSDLVAVVTNGNDRSVVRFSYYFESNGERFGERRDFVLPNEAKYIMALNQALPTGSGAPRLVVENISFNRLDRHTIPDWEQYRLERLNFTIDQAVFTPGAANPLSEKISLGELRFRISNQGAYGYRAASLSIILKRQGEVVGVNRHILGDFQSGQERMVTLVWPGRLPAVDQVDIVPDIDILDDSVYLRYSGQ